MAHFFQVNRYWENKIDALFEDSLPRGEVALLLKSYHPVHLTQSTQHSYALYARSLIYKSLEISSIKR